MKDIKPLIKAEHNGEILYNRDPMEFLLANDLAASVGNGLFVLKGTLTKILDKIEKLILKIADEVGAKRVAVPSILSWENTQKSQYLNSFKNQALMITPLENNKENPHPEFIGLASPTVCYHYFSSLQDKTINHNQAITALSKCTRLEEGPLTNLSRLTNFTMREIVFFGTKEYCSEKLKEVLDKTIEMLTKIFDLSFKVVTANDPFFGADADLKKKAQLVLESKYEMQTLLPFSNKTLSIASFNNHGKVFYNRFNILPRNSELTYSGCVGWGYERILYTILAQKGVNFSTPYYQRLLAEHMDNHNEINTQKEWESTYSSDSSSHKNKYPHTEVISFVMRNFGRAPDKSKIKILDLGCGWGNNLRFLKQEGFDYYGIDFSESAIEHCEKEFKNVRVGDISELPYSSDFFDLVLDRQSIQHNEKTKIKKIYDEVYRIVKPGGLFFSVAAEKADFNLFAAELSKEEVEKLAEKFSELEIDYREQSSNNRTRILRFNVIKARK